MLKNDVELLPVHYEFSLNLSEYFDYFYHYSPHVPGLHQDNLEAMYWKLPLPYGHLWADIYKALPLGTRKIERNKVSCAKADIHKLMGIQIRSPARNKNSRIGAVVSCAMQNA
jgi:hypothetical protein